MFLNKEQFSGEVWKVKVYLDRLLSAKARHTSLTRQTRHESILTYLHVPAFNIALVDVALVISLEILAKKVNENNTQILRESSIIMDDGELGSKNVGDRTQTLENSDALE